MGLRDQNPLETSTVRNPGAHKKLLNQNIQQGALEFEL